MSCTGDCGACFTAAKEQPHGVEMRCADGLFIKQMIIPKAGTLVPQHAHRWDHTSLLAVGTIEVWIEGKFERVARAPEQIFIEARVKHSFLALVDDVQIYCIHQLHGTDEVEVHEEHHIVGDKACPGQ